MKVVSEEIVLICLETSLMNATHLLRMIEVSARFGAASDMDIRIGRQNIEALENQIRIIKDCAFIGSDFYQKGIIA